ncbi:MAG: hypothetical protein J7M27_12165 [Candidatus Latescibacteria bacterium]|nr:hypothetical protein [Candidatus Latescibacterota bacterium]
MAWTGIWRGASDVDGQSGWDDNDHANKMRTMAPVGRAIFLGLLLTILPGRSSACSLLGELVQASTHILIGHVEDKEAYDSYRTDFSIGVEEQIKGAIESNPIRLYIQWPSPENVPREFSYQQVDRFGRQILQKSARVILFLRQEGQDFILTRVNWSIFSVEDGVVWGLDIPISDFIHEVRARSEGFLSPEEPGLLIEKIAEGTSQILIVRNYPYRYMTEQEWLIEYGQYVRAFKIEKLLWGVLPKLEYKPDAGVSWFVDSECILGFGDEKGTETYLAFARLIKNDRGSPSAWAYQFALACGFSYRSHCVRNCPEYYPIAPFGMLWIREGKVFPFDISIEDLVDEIAGLTGPEVAVQEATWGQLKALFRR